jgi:hypothetical protein
VIACSSSGRRRSRRAIAQAPDRDDEERALALRCRPLRRREEFEVSLERTGRGRQHTSEREVGAVEPDGSADGVHASAQTPPQKPSLTMTRRGPPGRPSASAKVAADAGLIPSSEKYVHDHFLAVDPLGDGRRR